MTIYLMPEDVKEVRVGDVGVRFSFACVKGNRKEVVDLTGFGGFFAFWTSSILEPHVRRAAFTTGVTGKVQYVTRGDEFAADGPCFAQATIGAPDWYLGGALGRWGRTVSSDILQFIVKPRPA